MLTCALIDLLIFITLDLASLVVQAIGGARASAAASNDEDAEPGGRIMLYGIVTQMVALTIYVALGVEFVVRYFLDKPVRKPAAPADDTNNASVDSYNEKPMRPIMDRNTKLMLLGLIINTVFLYIRYVPSLSHNFSRIDF
jgi:hypothetical protein